MKRAEREGLLRQGVALPETPRERRHRDALAEDLRSSPLTGQPLRLRLRNFRPAAEGYLASLGGPLPYMLRLREIDERAAQASDALDATWRALARECRDDEAFSSRWLAVADRWGFDEVNDLIERHNRWYPVEARLPMDPRTGDFALVNGKDYRLPALDAAWILERFPAERARALGPRSPG